jgi:hypothetical protein
MSFSYSRHHPDEFWMLTHRRRSNHRDTRLRCDSGRLNVEVIEHFNVVAQEAQRYDHRRPAREAAQDFP